MKKTRIDPDFQVTPRIVELAKQNNWPDPHSERDGFVDYWLGRGDPMADWEACFRTWLRNAAKWNKKPGVQRVSTYMNGTNKEPTPNLTPEERRANLVKLQELMAGIGKPIT